MLKMLVFSPIGNKGAKQTTPSGTAKRRWNETRSDAHQVEWSSSSEDDDIDVNHRVTSKSACSKFLATEYGPYVRPCPS